MERIKHFLTDDRASAEATSTVLLIGAVSIFLGAMLFAWWTNLGNFFSDAGSGMDALGDRAKGGIDGLKK